MYAQLKFVRRTSTPAKHSSLGLYVWAVDARATPRSPGLWVSGSWWEGGVSRYSGGSGVDVSPPLLTMSLFLLHTTVSQWAAAAAQNELVFNSWAPEEGGAFSAARLDPVSVEDLFAAEGGSGYFLELRRVPPLVRDIPIRTASDTFSEFGTRDSKDIVKKLEEEQQAWEAGGGGVAATDGNEWPRTKPRSERIKVSSFVLRWGGGGDGPSSGGGGGAEEGGVEGHGRDNDSFEVEAFGLLRLLLRLTSLAQAPEEEGLRGVREFLIFLDPDSVLAALKNPNSTDLRIGCIRSAANRLLTICPDLLLDLRWVPAHVGHTLNTEADWLAEELESVCEGWSGWARPVRMLKKEIVKSRRARFIAAEAARWRARADAGTVAWGGVARALRTGSLSPLLRRLETTHPSAGWLLLGVALGDSTIAGVYEEDHSVLVNGVSCCKLCHEQLGDKKSGEGLFDHWVLRCPKVGGQDPRLSPRDLVGAVTRVAGACGLQVPKWAPVKEKIPKEEDVRPEGFGGRAESLLGGATPEDCTARRRAVEEGLAEGGRRRDGRLGGASDFLFRGIGPAAFPPLPSQSHSSGEGPSQSETQDPSQSVEVAEPDDDDEILADDPAWRAWENLAPLLPAVATGPSSAVVAAVAESSTITITCPILAAKKANRLARREKVGRRREELDAWMEGVRRGAGQTEKELAEANLYNSGGKEVQFPAAAKRKGGRHVNCFKGMGPGWRAGGRKLIRMGEWEAWVLPPIAWLGPWLGGSLEEEGGKARAWGVRYLVGGVVRVKRFSLRKHWTALGALRAAEGWALENLGEDGELESGGDEVLDQELEEEEQ